MARSFIRSPRVPALFAVLSLPFAAQIAAAAPGAPGTPAAKADPAAKAGPAAKMAKADPIAEKIKALDLERLAAAARNDVEAYEKFLADDLTYIHSSGKLDGKKELLESIKSGKTKYSKFETKDVSVRAYGTAAIVNGEAHVEVQVGEEKRTNHILFTDVWVKRAGKWQMVSWNATKLPPATPAAPAAPPAPSTPPTTAPPPKPTK